MSNIVVVDNASTERGTETYLNTLEERGVKVIRRSERQPSVEFAMAMNEAYSASQSKYIAMLPADMQFIAIGTWIERFTRILDNNSKVGSIVLDAQRAVTHGSHRMSPLDDHNFFYDHNRYQVAPWGTLTRREDLAHAFPWDAELDAPALSNLELNTVKRIDAALDHGMFGKKISLVPKVPVAVSIWNDEGHQAKVRLNKRIGKYVPPITRHYYELENYEDLCLDYSVQQVPASIEQIAKPIGWKAPIDDKGQWIKTSVNIDTAGSYVSQDLT